MEGMKFGVSVHLESMDKARIQGTERSRKNTHTVVTEFVRRRKKTFTDLRETNLRRGEASGQKRIIFFSIYHLLC
jgi:hypothetical protein